jgi:hypothetical protein
MEQRAVHLDRVYRGSEKLVHIRGCAELIHRQQAKQSLRHVELEDLLVHVPEHHGLWREMLGIMDELLLSPPAR